LNIALFPYNGNSIEAFDNLRVNQTAVAFVDDSEEHKGKSYCDIPILTREEVTNRFSDIKWVASPGSPKSYFKRKEIIGSISIEPKDFTQIISPNAYVGKNTILGYNLIIMAGCVLTSNAQIGNHVLILPNTVIHHDSNVGDYSIIGSNVSVAGNVRIGENVYIGSGTRIKNGITIGKGALIGMGSNVIKDVKPEEVIVGNPGKLLDK
jgi:sugar O-acyltransferase (sialic acid O-acetyltransferase NeuD family)